MRMVIFDCNALCHAAKFSTRSLSFRGHKTGVIFGFTKSLIKLQENLRGDVVAFAWDSDSRQTSFRKEAYPAYKANRDEEKSPEDKRLDEIAKPQFNEIREKVLPALGFANIFMQPRLEADDIIGQIVRQQALRSDDWEVVMVTRDGDMYQLLSERVMMYDPVKKKFITAEGFTSVWGIEPKDWVLVKAIAGCSTDNVAGVPGVAEKTAIKFLNGELPPTGKIHRRIIEAEDDMLFKMSLVELPHAKTKLVEIISKDSTSKDRFIKVCEHYGFKSLLNSSSINRWAELYGRA